MEVSDKSGSAPWLGHHYSNQGLYVKRAIHHVKRFDLKYWKTSDILCIFRYSLYFPRQTNNCERILLQIIFLYDCSPRYLDTQRRNTRIRRPSNFFHFQYFESTNRSKHTNKGIQPCCIDPYIEIWRGAIRRRSMCTVQWCSCYIVRIWKLGRCSSCYSCV